MRQIVKDLIVIVYTLSVTYMAGKWAIEYAYMERGYEAFGGEYLFIPMVAWLSYKVINTFLDLLEAKKNADG